MARSLLSRTILLALCCCASAAWAQSVQRLATAGNAVPALLPESNQAANALAPAASATAPIDLGQTNLEPEPTPAATGTAANQSGFGVAHSAAQAARFASNKAAPKIDTNSEHVLFKRQPIRVALPLGRERLITLPAPAVLNVPDDMDAVARLEVIDRTIYATALVPFVPIRIVAELIDGGAQIPLDLVANKQTASATAELEVLVDNSKTGAGVAAAITESGTAQADQTKQETAANMVQLTRFAARQLYAPRRLAYAVPGIRQVALNLQPVPGLLRGVNVQTVPLGQWRSGDLYVTALRLTNLSNQPLDVPLEDIRGRWVAATAQHGHIGVHGSDSDTTALYLVCERPFESCL